MATAGTVDPMPPSQGSASAAAAGRVYAPSTVKYDPNTPESLLKPTNAHLIQAKSLWDIKGELSFVRKVENWIYQAKEERLFLRLTEPAHRSEPQLKSELSWMAHLEKQGLKFAHPAKSKKGNHVESVTLEGSTYFVCAFHEAEGKPLTAPEGYNPLVLEKWGRLIGQMHSATKTFRLVPEAQPRPQWNEERNYSHIHRLIKKEDGKLYDRFQELDAWLRSLPKGKEAYGLIHADLHNGNFFVTTQNEITVFDFDDCHYQWFPYDIAVPAFFISFSLSSKSSDLRWEDLSDSFWKGYSSANSLPDFWIKSVPRFIEFRTFVMYYWGVANLQNNELSEKARDWIKNALIYCRNEIETGIL